MDSNNVQRKPVDAEVTSIKLISTKRNFHVDEYVAPEGISGSKFIGKLRALLVDQESAPNTDKLSRRQDSLPYGEGEERSTHSFTIQDITEPYSPEHLSRVSGIEHKISQIRNEDLELQIEQFKSKAREADASALAKGYKAGSPLYRQELSEALSALPSIEGWGHQLQVTIRNKLNIEGTKLNKADGLYYQTIRSKVIYSDNILDNSMLATIETKLENPEAINTEQM